MKISCDWLTRHIDISEDLNEIAEKLTKSGLEVEGIETVESITGGLKGVVIGEVLTCEQHPNADKLSKTTVDIGADMPVPIVCGAPNVAQGQKVVVATVGTTLYPEGHDSFKIKKAKIRGEVSEGMICAEDELGLGKSHDGIMVLETSLPNGTPAASYFQLEDDTILEIGLTPNRADAASHYGVARELQVLLNRPLKTTFADIKSDISQSPVEIIIENQDACPRFCGVSIENIKVEDSPEWLQNKLKSIGIAPSNNIVDITNFVLHDLGQPLHAYDLSKITSGKVCIKTLPDNTLFTTLDEVERKLHHKDLLVCDDSNPMCIAGVFGGINSGVIESTTNIFLESAYFSTEYVRKTSLRHGLKTDAAFRFERGTDPNIPLKALKYATNLILEICPGATITSPFIDEYPKPIENFEFEVSINRINRLIGIAIPKEDITRILSNLEINIIEDQGDLLRLSVPPYRVDVQREADIVEEIIRIYGYDNVAESDVMGSDYLAPAINEAHESGKRKCADLLAGNGFQEIMTNSLSKAAYTDATGLVNDDENVHILNKLSEDLGIMRQTPLFTGLEILAHNINRRQEHLKLFEFAKSYKLVNGQYEEKENLILFITGNKKEESWQTPSSPSDFYSIKNTVGLILQRLGIQDVSSEESNSPLFEMGVTLTSNNNSLGHLGLVNEKWTDKTGVKQDVWYAELDPEVLFVKKNNNKLFKEVSKFPEVRRDLSLVIDKSTSFQEIQALAQKTERKLLKQVNAFDSYHGEHIEDGKKSYSVSFVLQDNKQTLTDKVIDKTMTRLIKAYEQELNAIIRK